MVKRAIPVGMARIIPLTSPIIDTMCHRVMKALWQERERPMYKIRWYPERLRVAGVTSTYCQPDQHQQVHSDQHQQVHSDQHQQVQPDQHQQVHSDQHQQVQPDQHQQVHSDQHKQVHSDQHQQVHSYQQSGPSTLKQLLCFFLPQCYFHCIDVSTVNLF